jgi:hypothetical protein
MVIMGATGVVLVIATVIYDERGRPHPDRSAFIPARLDVDDVLDGAILQSYTDT